MPKTASRSCSLTYEVDVPFWEAVPGGRRVPVSVPERRGEQHPTVLGGYNLLGNAWADTSAGDPLVALGQPSDGTLPADIFSAFGTMKHLWAQGGMYCTVSSLTNFMIALKERLISGVSVEDFVDANRDPNDTSDMSFGHGGGNGASAYCECARAPKHLHPCPQLGCGLCVYPELSEALGGSLNPTDPL